MILVDDILKRFLVPISTDLREGWTYNLIWHQDKVGSIERADFRGVRVSLLEASPHFEKLSRCFARDQIQLWICNGEIRMRLKRRSGDDYNPKEEISDSSGTAREELSFREQP